VPIVFAAVPDPVGEGFVASLPRPERDAVPTIYRYREYTVPGGLDPSIAEANNSAKRRQIVEGARSVFLAHGFDASMGEIAKAAGVSKGTLYVYFKDKGGHSLARACGGLRHRGSPRSNELYRPVDKKVVASLPALLRALLAQSSGKIGREPEGRSRSG
jgi:hypothetical protein